MAVSLHNLDEMFAVANEMLHLALEAYEQENLTFAKQIAEMDDSVDEIYGKAIREFISSVRNNGSNYANYTIIICREIY